MDPETSRAQKRLEHMLDGTAEPIALPLSLLTAITNGFAENRKIGSGGFAVVYKGMLQNGAVAVKRMHGFRDQNETRFIRELDCLMRLKHKNIVRLLGYYANSQGEELKDEGKSAIVEERQMLLCLKYVPRGSLDNYITDISHGLEWKRCYQIIRGICEGLHHLHDKRIVHLDLNSGNILLDYNMLPKICDFGNSRFLDEYQTQEIEQNITGSSFGYLAPETLGTGVITFKSDIYALGIIITQILTGKKQYSSIFDMNDVLEGWRSRLAKSGEDTPLEQIRVCVEISISCLDPNPNKRPAMQHIIEALYETESMTLDTQRRRRVDKFIEAGIGTSLQTEVPSNGIQLQQSTPMISSGQRRGQRWGGGSWSPHYRRRHHGRPAKPPLGWRSKMKTESGAGGGRQGEPPLGLNPASAAASGVESSEMKTESGAAGGRQGEPPPGLNPGSAAASGGESFEIVELNILERIVADCEEPSHLDLPLLYSITENFSKNKRIGKGGCGEVYKGILRNGVVAVKRLFNNRTIKDRMFHREVKSLITVRHQNVVRFLGYCSFTEERAIPFEERIVMVEIRERLLCFEYISNGSLERHLTDELRGLEWRTRFNIIVGICNGLCYLHKNNIIHMDLKPANILLVDQMVPKITDFGLSRLANNPQATTTSRLISPGYSAPEYRSEGKSSLKSDIYSLGVIILELVSGSKNNTNITTVLRKWRCRWIKSSKHTPLGYQQVTKCIDLAQRCMEHDPADRPDISDIVQELSKIDSNDDQLQVIPSLEDMLGIEPLEIQFPFELYRQVSHTVELSNDTDDHFAFVTKPSLPRLRTEPDKGIVAPRSKCSVTITMMRVQVMALPYNCYKEEITVLSTRVHEGLAAVDITKDMFIEKEGKVVDAVNVMVVFDRPPLEEES